MTRALFVANGHGETAIAARIATELVRLAPPASKLDLFPLVGVGLGAQPLCVVGPRATMPSGGLVAMGNVRAFSRDLRAGFLGLLGRQLAFLRAARAHYDVTVAVGDVYALGLAFLTTLPTVFVGTAKSVYVAPYGPFERTLLRRARLSFVRDAATARALVAQRVEAHAPGNVIVDLADEPAPSELEPSLGIFPGSRTEAYADGLRLGRVVRELAKHRPNVRALFSVAPTLEADRFATLFAGAGWDVEHGSGERAFVARSEGAVLQAWSGPSAAVLRASTIVIGQAGTANEQAAALGIPVVALDGGGAREAWYRMRQRRLLGDALLLAPNDPAAAAKEIDALLGDPAARERMRAAGRERMGPPGGAAAIARAIVDLGKR